MINIKNVIFEKLKELDEEDSKDISQVLFPVITYIEKYKNFENEVVLTKNLILENFNIRTSTRNLSKVSKSIEFLISLDIVQVVNDVSVISSKGNTMIHILINEDDRLYRRHEVEFINKLIKVIQDSNERFACGLVFYYIAYKIRYYSYGSGYTDARISYQEIVDALSIGSRNTVGKYVRLLEKESIIISKTKDKKGVDKSGDKLKEVYKVYSMPNENNKDKNKSK